MKIQLIAIGDKMPKWAKAGFEEYANRMPADMSLELKQIRAATRTKHQSTNTIIKQEEKRLQAAISASCHLIALDVNGSHWSTEQLAEQVRHWRELAQPIALIVGGADGLSEPLIRQSRQRWSLSSLTFPHYLVRVLIAEQLYRAWTILNHHPYHRG
ncbi:MAG: 23S rRNA (pseudouridine(1915)-N(3))-methyltransferase RlmH [Gammaproteobacteria bacterium]|nr:23S rRNA (pseudouridine(1915)-N(3))-methyltransferase RlmH [Gammaproteobacteria bacterium]